MIIDLVGLHLANPTIMTALTGYGVNMPNPAEAISTSWIGRVARPEVGIWINADPRLGCASPVQSADRDDR